MKLFTLAALGAAAYYLLKKKAPGYTVSLPTQGETVIAPVSLQPITIPVTFVQNMKEQLIAQGISEEVAESMAQWSERQVKQTKSSTIAPQVFVETTTISGDGPGYRYL